MLSKLSRGMNKPQSAWKVVLQTWSHSLAGCRWQGLSLLPARVTAPSKPWAQLLAPTVADLLGKNEMHWHKPSAHTVYLDRGQTGMRKFKEGAKLTVLKWLQSPSWERRGCPDGVRAVGGRLAGRRLERFTSRCGIEPLSGLPQFWRREKR